MLLTWGSIGITTEIRYLVRNQGERGSSNEGKIEYRVRGKGEIERGLNEELEVG